MSEPVDLDERRQEEPLKTAWSEQNVLNYSFDEAYKILMVGLAAFNSSTGNYDRLQITNTGELKTTASFSGNFTGAAAYKTADGVDAKGLVDADGHVQADILTLPAITIANNNPLDKYQPSDIERGTTYNYYGFVDAEGNWYITRENAAETEYRYFKGTTNYATNWAGRAALAYGYFFDVF